MKDSVAHFMAAVHTSVNEMSVTYLTNERRYNYTTPKSFLEQIKLYQSLLTRQHADLLAKMQRLENGLEKLESTASQVGHVAAQLVGRGCCEELTVGNPNLPKSLLATIWNPLI